MQTADNSAIRLHGRVIDFNKKQIFFGYEHRAAWIDRADLIDRSPGLFTNFEGWIVLDNAGVIAQLLGKS